MKILIISRGYPTSKYKMNGIFEFDQAKALFEAGVDVVYAVVDVRSIRRWRKWGYESFVKEGVQIEAINVPCGRMPNKLLDKVKEASLKRLYKRIVSKYGEFDIIHSHFIGMGYVTAKLFKNGGISLIHTEHYSGLNQEELSKYYENLANNTYKYMDKVIAVSEYFASNLRKKFQINPIVIHNIVDASSFKYESSCKSKDKFNFISVGGLTDNKRMDLLINSFYDAFKDQKKVKLYIYGAGPQRKKLERLIENLKLTNQIFLMGLVNRKEISYKMSDCHCFVLASKSETFGVAYIEAMAAGLPVIATKSGGPESFVNESNGVIISVDNQLQLTQALIYMFNNIDKYNRDKISYNTIKKFASNNIAQLIIREYNNVLNE